MAQWSGGQVAPGLVDNYPLPPKDPLVEITPRDVRRLLGIELSVQEIAALLERLEFKCEIRAAAPASRIANGDSRIIVHTPPHRLDIGEGVVGVADVIEEIARLYGYDRIPETRMADVLPPQVGNPDDEWLERLRDLLVSLGLQEVVTYRMTSPEREARLAASGGAEPRQEQDYLHIANPITPEKRVLRRSLLASLLDVVERNARLRASLAFFETGPIFIPAPGERSEGALPDEPLRLAVAMTGRRHAPAWDVEEGPPLDFYDLKGRIESLLAGLRLTDVAFAPAEHPVFHPAKCAAVKVGGRAVGVFGELHPLVQAKYEFGAAPVLAAEFDLDALRALPIVYELEPVPEFPPVLEDIAVIVDEAVPAAQVEALIRQTGGKMVAAARLFDVYRGEQVGAGKKSLAYSLAYQAPDRTLTDAEAAQLRSKIVRRLEQEVGAQLRG